MLSNLVCVLVDKYNILYRSNKRVSILVTVLDNDERINSDNFEDLLKSSLQRHPSASSFQLLNATVYGKYISYRS